MVHITAKLIVSYLSLYSQCASCGIPARNGGHGPRRDRPTRLNAIYLSCVESDIPSSKPVDPAPVFKRTKNRGFWTSPHLEHTVYSHEASGQGFVDDSSMLCVGVKTVHALYVSSVGQVPTYTVINSAFAIGALQSKPRHGFITIMKVQLLVHIN